MSLACPQALCFVVWESTGRGKTAARLLAHQASKTHEETLGHQASTTHKETLGHQASTTHKETLGHQASKAATRLARHWESSKKPDKAMQSAREKEANG